jgi:hypothetical protein
LATHNDYCTDATLNALMPDYTSYNAVWDALTNNAATYATVPTFYKPRDTRATAYLYSANGWPYTGGFRYGILSRAIFLETRGGKVRGRCHHDEGFGFFIDEGERSYEAKFTQSEAQAMSGPVITLTKGWHTIDWFIGQTTGGYCANFWFERYLDNVFTRADFTGTIDIPNGVTFTQSPALSPKIVYVGSGTLVPTSAATAPTDGFSGTIALGTGIDRALSGGDLAAWGEVELQDGATLRLPSAYLAQASHQFALPDWTTGAWSLNGTTLTSGYKAGPAYVDSDNALVLTDDGGNQRRSAYLTNFPVLVSDVWRVDFTYDANPLDADETHNGEGFTFVIQNSGATACDTSAAALYALPSTAFGFALKQNPDSGVAFDWVVAGVVGSDTSITPEALGISFLEPIDISVSCANRRMTVTLRQGDRSISRSCNVATPLDASAVHYIGFTAGTEITDNRGIDIGLVQRVTSFSGWLQRPSFGEGQHIPFDDEHWQLNGKTYFTNGTDLVFHYTNLWSESAVCRLPVSTTNALRFSVTNISYHANRFWPPAPGKNPDYRPGTTLGHGFQDQGTNFWLNAQGNWSLPNYDASCGAIIRCDDLSSQQGYHWYEKRSITRIGYLNSSFDPRTYTPLTNVVDVTFDGGSNLLLRTYNCANGGNNYAGRSFSAFGKMTGGEMYLTLLAGQTVSDWACQPHTMQGFTVYDAINADMPVRLPVEVAADATATLSVGAWGANLDKPSASLDSLVLNSGSTANIASDSTIVAPVGVSMLNVNGSGAAIAAQEGAIFALGGITLHEDSGKVRITGNWMIRDGLLTVVVPASWSRRGRIELADATGATFLGDVDGIAVRVIYDDGTVAVDGVYRVIVHSGNLSIIRDSGSMLLLR